MHRAPSVSFPVVRSHRHLRVLAMFLALSAGACVAVVSTDTSEDSRWALVLISMGTGAVFAGLQWMRAPQGVLRWDGGQWLWESASRTESCAVQQKFDFQKVIVVRIRRGSGESWYHWIDEKAAPHRWPALRRALVSQTLHPLVVPDEVPSNGSEGQP